MSSTKKTSKPKVIFGTPVAELPDPKNGGWNRGPAQHWIDVAEGAKAQPGIWHPITIDTLTAKAHQSASSAINAASRNSQSKTGKNMAFAEPGFQAAYRKGVLYVRYDAPAVAKLRRAQ